MSEESPTNTEPRLRPLRIQIVSDSSVHEVERKVDELFGANPGMEIVSVTQSESMEGQTPTWSFTLTIIYREP